MCSSGDTERIEFAQKDRWIPYPLAQNLLDELERLRRYPDSSRPPNLLLVANSNNGKSTLVEHFRDQHPPINDPRSGRTQRPVVLIDAPATPSEDRLYTHLLQKIGAVFKIRDPVDRKLFVLIELLHKIGTKVLIIDEINNTLAGNTTQRQSALNAIKEISNNLRRPLVLTGTHLAQSVLRDDEQLQNRFPPQVLVRWSLDREFQQLLVSFEMTLPLKKPSKLASEEMAILLLEMSGGLIGDLSNLLKLAAEQAIRDGSECITRSLLLKLNWLPPGKRSAAAGARLDGVDYTINYAAVRKTKAPPQV